MSLYDLLGLPILPLLSNCHDSLISSRWRSGICGRDSFYAYLFFEWAVLVRFMRVIHQTATFPGHGEIFSYRYSVDLYEFSYGQGAFSLYGLKDSYEEGNATYPVDVFHVGTKYFGVMRVFSVG